MYKEIVGCRICRSTDLVTVLDLGEQALTGIFPRSATDAVTVGPLILVKCMGGCGLLQLKHSYTLSEMYGDQYGYRSGLNASMVRHLREKVDHIKQYGLLDKGDIVLDIGSNDGTTLAQYELDDIRLVGMDPTSAKFKEYYVDNALAIADFFNADTFRKHFGEEKAKIVTSFSMFYDLEDPVAFVKEIRGIIHDNGIWVLEQSYLPMMLETNSYDTVCHEHLEYYTLAQIEWMMDRCDMRVVDVSLNGVNGGSFSVVVQPNTGQLPVAESVAKLRLSEQLGLLDDLAIYSAFRDRVMNSRIALIDFLREASEKNKTVVALGASTKGNVVLQYCNITGSMVSSVGEVNPDKYGAVTPGTHIPILDESDVLADNPDYVLILPWHFRDFFEEQEKYKSLNLVFALPYLEIRHAK